MPRWGESGATPGPGEGSWRGAGLKAEREVAGRAFQDEQPVRARVQGERKRVALGFVERGAGEKSLHLTLRENRSRLILTNQSKQI